MGIRNIFARRKKEQPQEEVLLQEESEQDPKPRSRKDAGNFLRPGSPAERINFIKDNCELILESNRRMDEAKLEYQAVTSYLTDMQKIDMIPEEQREDLNEAARKIINLNKERGKLQNKSKILSDRQYKLYESYEYQIPKELPRIHSSEDYQAVIQKDLAHLEKERKALNREENEIISKQSFLKGIAIVTSVVVISLFLLFALLSAGTKANFTIPFLLTVLMGMGCAVYIFLEARKNSGDVRLVQAKINRQIMLMNKVKIKSVNNRNYLDYTYSKYMALNYEQMKKSWEEYVRLKDEAHRYQSNTELLDFFNNELIHELKKSGVVDAEVWIYQPSAILDSKEMVEVRHRLNVRRQKLREQIDLSNKQKEEALREICQLMKANPEVRDEAEKLARSYRIELEN